jgi:hypothetical protein
VYSIRTSTGNLERFERLWLASVFYNLLNLQGYEQVQLPPPPPIASFRCMSQVTSEATTGIGDRIEGVGFRWLYGRHESGRAERITYGAKMKRPKFSTSGVSRFQ